jgi:hypothetical protein
MRLYASLLILLFFSVAYAAPVKQRVYLDVPLVEQGKLLCGPATIEMLFRYWGIEKYDQYDIAGYMLQQFSSSTRYRKSGIYDSYPVNWDKYPGTTTGNMYRFLLQFSRTHQFMLEYEAESIVERSKKRDEMFNMVKWYVSNGVPVIVHQYWKFGEDGMHYRIVTGYDEVKKMVYLNDSDGGKRIVQTYDEFMALWNINQRWLHYNAIAFNVARSRLNIEL